MTRTTYYAGTTWIHQLDPRVRIIFAFLISLLVVLSWKVSLLTVSFSMGLASAAIAQLPFKALLARLLRVNVFMLALVLVFPLTTPGKALFHVGPFAYTVEGLTQAGLITLKANAIVLLLSAWIGTIEIFTLGHALHHLHVPAKLTHLFLFSVRYLEVLHREYEKLLRAMKIRGFQPAMNLHTYRSYGYLAGMVLVRSLDRSERIVASMKCRGFTGSFYAYHHFHIQRRDLLFSFAAVFLLALLSFMQYG